MIRNFRLGSPSFVAQLAGTVQQVVGTALGVGRSPVVDMAAAQRKVDTARREAGIAQPVVGM